MKIAEILDLSVIPLYLRKRVMYGPTCLLLSSLLYSLSELRAYKKAVINRKDVVGRPGTKIPTTPIARESVPKKMNNNFSMAYSIDAFFY